MLHRKEMQKGSEIYSHPLAGFSLSQSLFHRSTASYGFKPAILKEIFTDLDRNVQKHRRVSKIIELCHYANAIAGTS